jgi:hypothetical protein
MRWTRKENCTQKLWMKNLKEGDHLLDLGISDIVALPCQRLKLLSWKKRKSYGKYEVMETGTSVITRRD